MTQINRRALIGAAGTGLLLAGCKAGGPAATDTPTPTPSNCGPTPTPPPGPGGPSGECNQYGDLVCQEKPDGHSEEFKFDNICLVYITLEGEKIKVRHAYWKKDTTDLAGQIKLGMMELKAGHFSNAPYRVEDNFERFGFNSRHRIYFLVDYDPIELNFMPGGVEHKIRFAPISSNTKITTTMYPNSAFYNMKEYEFSKQVESTWGSPNLKGYSLDYWNLDSGGHEISNAIDYKDYTKYHLFSMNIHLMMKKVPLPAPTMGSVGHPQPVPHPNDAPVGTPPLDFIPLVLDPDTGNMGGSP